MVAKPQLFAMPLMPHADAVLVLDSGDAGPAGDYDVYSIAPEAQDRLWGDWDVIRAGLVPTDRSNSRL